MARSLSDRSLEPWSIIRACGKKPAGSKPKLKACASSSKLLSISRARRRSSTSSAQLTKALRNDLHERDAIFREAILAFEALSESLYERAGSLTIAETGSGPQFDVHIDGQRSKGITNMPIFCFDLMLTEISLKQGRGPGFLLHDSHLFDGVSDSRR